MHRRAFLTGSVTAGTGLLAGCSGLGGGGGDTVRLQIHTAAEGASHYNMSAPLVQLLPENSEDPKLEATVSTSDGSVANMRRLGEGNTDIGTSVDQVAHLASNGQGPFDDEVDIRIVSRAEVVTQFYVVRQDSDIETVSDLDGKSVTAGPAGSGTLGQHQALMEQYGIETENVHLGYSEGGRALRDGDVDAWFIFYGSPVTNAFATDGDRLRFARFTDDEMKGLQEAFPWTTQTQVTPDMLENYDSTIQAMGTNGFWITTPDMDAEVVREFVEVITNNPKPIREANVNSREFGLEYAYYDFGVPYHEGALEYFEEEGVA